MKQKEEEDSYSEMKEHSPTIEERRNLRISSNPKENSVKSLERLFFANQYMHQSYKPQLDHIKSFEHAQYVLKENRAKMKEEEH